MSGTGIEGFIKSGKLAIWRAIHVAVDDIVERCDYFTVQDVLDHPEITKLPLSAEYVERVARDMLHSMILNNAVIEVCDGRYRVAMRGENLNFATISG